MLYIFRADGSFEAVEDGSVITNTDDWTASDWEEIDRCLAGERTFVVRGIKNGYAMKRLLEFD